MRKSLILFFILCVCMLYGCGKNNINVSEKNKYDKEMVVDQKTSESDDQALLIDPELIWANGDPEPAYDLYFVCASESSQKLDYIVYTPAEYNEKTPVFTFLHGDGDTARTFSEELDRYEFLRKLQNGQWQPNVIFIMPVARKKANWHNEVKNVKKILEETTSDLGIGMDNLYISGASAGANGMSILAKEVEFKGAVYMAGFLGGELDTIPAEEWLGMWQGKPVYYYRDNLFTYGGYGYRTNTVYLEELSESFELYDIDFKMIDLQWNHDIGLVDATFLPSEYLDQNGNKCHGAIDRIISQ